MGIRAASQSTEDMHHKKAHPLFLVGIESLIERRPGISELFETKLGLAHPARSLPAHPHKSAHRLHASVVVPTYVNIPSDLGLTLQHNSLAHNIKLYAER